MLKLLASHVARRLQWRRQARLLDGMSSMEQFESYVRSTRPKVFLSYRGKSADKRREFEGVFRTLGLEVRGKAFLDIGTAYGDWTCATSGAPRRSASSTSTRCSSRTTA